jgi:hypothetical protein
LKVFWNYLEGMNTAPLTDQCIQSPIKLDSLARQRRQLVLKAVDILYEITEEAVSSSEVIEKVVKLGRLCLGSTGSHITNYLVKIRARLDRYIEQVAARVAARIIAEVGNYKGILDELSHISERWKTHSPHLQRCQRH